MAKIHSNLVTQGLSGSLGRDLMLRRLADGRTILCVKPDFSKRTLSDEQQTHHQRFREGAAYARGAARSQPIYAQVAAGTMKTAYNIALADWFHAPVIHAVEMMDGYIRVRASDNVYVAQVRVSILNEDGELWEQGEAVETGSGSGWWQYRPGRFPQDGEKFIVEARDLAGNVTQVET